jgi:membrane-associated protease RseP (regulator of RpoE activity)
MDLEVKVGIALAITWSVTLPLIVIVHELGHALATRWVAGRRSVVSVGRQPAMIDHQTQWFWFRIHPMLDLAGQRLGYCLYDRKGLTLRQEREIILAGPLASFLLAFVGAAVAYLADDPKSLAWMLGVGAFATAVIATFEDLIPRTAPGGQISDGEGLRRLREPAADEASRR